MQRFSPLSFSWMRQKWKEARKQGRRSSCWLLLDTVKVTKRWINGITISGGVKLISNPSCLYYFHSTSLSAFAQKGRFIVWSLAEFIFTHKDVIVWINSSLICSLKLRSDRKFRYFIFFWVVNCHVLAFVIPNFLSLRSDEVLQEMQEKEQRTTNMEERQKWAEENTDKDIHWECAH